MIYLNDINLFYVVINISNTNTEYIVINYCSNTTIESIKLYDNEWSIIYENFIEDNCLTLTYPEYIGNIELKQGSYYMMINDNNTLREFNLSLECYTNTSTPGMLLRKSNKNNFFFLLESKNN